MKTTVSIMTMLLSAVVSAPQNPITGCAPFNGLKMYFEIHGSGDPAVLFHGSFMTISNNWTGWISELSKTRKDYGSRIYHQNVCDATITGG